VDHSTRSGRAATGTERKKKRGEISCLVEVRPPQPPSSIEVVGAKKGTGKRRKERGKERFRGATMASFELFYLTPSRSPRRKKKEGGKRIRTSGSRQAEVSSARRGRAGGKEKKGKRGEDRSGVRHPFSTTSNKRRKKIRRLLDHRSWPVRSAERGKEKKKKP